MKIERITLELLRPGPPHGRLLSPLTQYIALCEEHGPVTFQVDLEHWDLLRQLALLRYEIPSSRGGSAPVENSLRESTLKDLGFVVRRLLHDLVTMPAELGRASAESELVHLRLIVSGSELALLPFELGIAPLGYPGEGVELLLQRRVPTIITREARRGRPLPMTWNKAPRILFVSAQPDGTHVPLREHLHVLRQALDPWVKRARDAEGKVGNVKKLLTVLPDASVSAVKRACRDGDYTHVHILAHGAAHKETTENQFGVLLCSEKDRHRGEIVDGQRLAQALQPDLSERGEAERPSVVSLATCDSGNVGSVVAPGASIAHDLQVFGIPLVFASQFPLTKRGSVEMVGKLYEGLLRGDDPRVLLYNLRDSICVSGVNDHDWASLVAYASLPEDFAHQVNLFRARQTRAAIDVQLEWAEASAGQDKDGKTAEAAIDNARRQLASWRATLPEIRPQAGGMEQDQARARALAVECYGVSGATEKRGAEIYHQRKNRAKAKELLHAALDWYQRAVAVDPTAHWPATQYLSLTAVLKQEAEPAVLRSVMRWARRDLESPDPGDKAWAHGTLAELEMLRLYHEGELSQRAQRAVRRQVEEHCKQIVALVGMQAFHVQSTCRQFKRYVDWWHDSVWEAVAPKAVQILGG